MKRREFITLLGGAAATCPMAARAQQGECARQIGVLMTYREGDPEVQSWLVTFRRRLRELGWSDGDNIRIESSFERR